MLDDFLTQIGPEEGEEEYEMMQEYFKSCKKASRESHDDNDDSYAAEEDCDGI